MKRFIMMSITAALMSGAALAEDVKVHVKGMVCAFCAQGIEHTLKDEDAVEGVKVDLDNGFVTIATKEGATLSDETIGTIITDAGFTVEKIERHE